MLITVEAELGCRLNRAAVWSIALLAALLLPSAARSQQVITGTFTVVWADASGSSMTKPQPLPPIYVVVEDDGTWTKLDVPDATLRRLGGIRALQGARVTVSGQLELATPAPGGRALRAMRASSLSQLTAAAAQAQTGARPMITVLCEYPDSTTPKLDKSVFESWVAPGTDYPGLDNWIRETSYGQLNFTGSKVVGWYKLPHGFTYYWTSDGFDLNGMIRDCAGAADADVYFPQYADINLQVTGGGSASYGSASWPVTIDGQTKSYGLTWQNFTDLSAFAHEVGHSLGWPHSAGPYGHAYDSKWDVMSSRTFFDWSVVSPSWVQQQTIMAHRDLVGWLAPDRKLVVTAPKEMSLVLERGAQPASPTSYLELVFPTATSPEQFYTAEARRFVGYDKHLPLEGVILHTVDWTRAEAAHVVDIDGNGDPNDAGAAWTPGETFTDSLNGISLHVDSATATGYGVSIVRGWRILVHVVGPGSVAMSSGGTCTDSCSKIFATAGTKVTLAADPGPGALLVGWSGVCAKSGSTCEIELGSNREVEVKFALPVVIATGTTPPAAVMGSYFADTLTVSGGSGGIEWSLSAGTLPEGLTLDATRGILAGTPAEAGKFAFSISARSGTLVDTKQVSLVVTKPVLDVADVMNQLLGTTGPLSTDAVHFLDLLGNRNGRFDIGDARSWLIDTGVLTASSSMADVVSALDTAKRTTKEEGRP